MSSLSELVAVSARVAETRSRKEKIGLLVDYLRELAAQSPQDIARAVAYLTGNLPQGRIGLSYSRVSEARHDPSSQSSLSLADVDTVLAAIQQTTGNGSTGKRRELVGSLFHRATADEQDFLARLIVGELRQGALDGVILEGVAAAANVPPPKLRRAAMLNGNLPKVAASALERGEAGLSEFSLKLLAPISPMLAQTANDVSEALDHFGRHALEYKMDGARIQLHKVGNDVRLFSRGMLDVTHAAPEIVRSALTLPAHSLVLDAEAIALNASGKPHPFQVTMRRLGRRIQDSNVQQQLPLSSFAFDVLHLNGHDLLDEPAESRFRALSETLPPSWLMPRMVTSDETEARSFFQRALDAGHEGLMAKSLSAPYEAGNRGASWLKIKPAHVLDLVVLAAEWGSGRRRGFLSNIHLGARDAVNGGFVMLGKTFKGMTDEMLAWQTSEFPKLEVARDAYTVYLRPECVVEIAFDGVQSSSQYPGGVALRFARVKKYRPDKTAAEADTLETVLAIHRGEKTVQWM